MPVYQLDPALQPEGLWNSQLACLASLTRAAGLPFDMVEVAGISGLAFRTVLARNAAAASLNHAWPWLQDFTQRTAALGLDSQCSLLPAGSPSLPRWAARQRMEIEQGLAQGWPAVFWNGLSFSLILGCGEDDCLVSGLNSARVNPELRGIAEIEQLIERCAAPVDGPAQRRCGWDALFGLPGEDCFVLTLAGRLEQPQQQLDELGMLNCWLELSGRSEYARLRVGLGQALEVQRGTSALQRLGEELREDSVQPFGLLQALSSLVELRRYSAPYLRRLALRSSAYAPRLEQCAQFSEQALSQYRSLLAIHSGDDGQLRPPQRQQARQHLWEGLRFEETVQRLLGGVVQEIFETGA